MRICSESTNQNFHECFAEYLFAAFVHNILISYKIRENSVSKLVERYSIIAASLSEVKTYTYYVQHKLIAIKYLPHIVS